MRVSNIQSEKRILLLFMVFCTVMLLLIAKLGYIQIVKSQEYKEMALLQQTRSIPVGAKRGDILDRNGVKLVYSMKSYAIWANPKLVDKPEIAIQKISEILNISVNKIDKTIQDQSKDIVRLANKIDREMAELIDKENLKGVWISDDTSRVYPYGNFLAHVLGHTTDDNQGIAGIEQSYNEELTGRNGKKIVQTDGSGRQLPYGVNRIYDPVNGYDLVLTIDEVIQFFMEKAVDKALNESQAKNAMAVMMNVKTGEILGMVSKPDYDLNNPRVPLDLNLLKNMESMSSKEKVDIWNTMWRNPIVSNLYESGSPFKLITGAAALEENVVTFNSEFEDKGYVDVEGVRLRCWSWRRPHGKQTFVEGMQNSCNPVFIELGKRLGVEVFYEYVDSFGFTMKTGIDLPAESRPLVQNIENVGPVELATMTYGHGLSITPLQMVTALSAIGNGGKLMKPYVVNEIYDTEGNLVKNKEPEYLRQVISEETSKQMLQIMESVVTDGSGKKAYIPGYRIGGKTGTTNKIVDGVYSEDKVFSSFAAIAPINDPEIALLIVIDEPTEEHFGSLVAAPVAREILKDTLRYLEIEPELGIEIQNILVPDLIGQDIKNAQLIVEGNGLIIDFMSERNQNSSYRVIDQYPKRGNIVMEGSTIIIKVEEQK